jgi:hypothetical protein
LRACLTRLDAPARRIGLGQSGRAYIAEHHAPAAHFRRLTEI